MKLNTVEVPIERVGVANTESFKIKASAKAFRILSDGLYSDKILAVIRELSSNALDAHIAAGNEAKQFDVHMPNRIEPFFAIRDYGVGLSHDDVMNLYSTYFDSTKTESNDYTGSLGLGSKSPFSYVESFSVTSYFNNEMNVYLVDMGEAGVPQISLVDGFPIQTIEPNGIEVKFAVKSEDFNEFKQKAQKIYSRYEPLPNILGDSGFTVQQKKVIMQGDDWRVFDSNTDAFLAVQGSVAYPIEIHKLRGYFENNIDIHANGNVELTFDIGELDIAANRESLGYDDRTCKNIVTKIRKFRNEVTKDVQTEFAKCKTLWEAHKLFNEMFRTSRTYNGYGGNVKNRMIYNIVSEILEYDGQKITGRVLLIPDEKFLFSYNFYDGSYNVCRRKTSTFSDRLVNNRSKTIIADDNTIFVHDDLNGKRQSNLRVKHYGESLDNKVSIVVLKPKTRKALIEVKKQIGLKGVKLLKTSSLPLPPKGSKSVVRTNAYEITKDSRAYYEKDVWERNPSFDMTNNKGFYVVLDNQKICMTTHFSNRTNHPYRLNNTRFLSIVNTMKTLKIIDPNDHVIGLNKIGFNKLKKMKNHGWVDLIKFSQKQLENICQNEKKEIITHEQISTYQRKAYGKEFIKLSEILKEKFANSKNKTIFCKAAELFSVKGALDKRYDTIKFLCNELGHSFYSDITRNADLNILERTFNNAMKMYPLIECYLQCKQTERATKQDIEHLVSYIKSV